MTDELIIQQTQNWIKEVVIGCNFCPFAAKAMLKQNIRYTVLTSVNIQESLEQVAKEMLLLDDEPESETSFIIFANNFTSFSEYLLLVDKAEQLLSKTGYDGIYQLASFHPDYCFAGSDVAFIAGGKHHRCAGEFSIPRKNSSEQYLFR